MSRSPSLTRRLLLELGSAQLVAIVLAWLIGKSLGSVAALGVDDFSLADYYSSFRIRRLVGESISRSADHALRFAPNAELRAELDSTPDLKIAVFEKPTGPAIEGSARDLAEAIEQIKSLAPTGIDFYLPTDVEEKHSVGMWRAATPEGTLYIATSGGVFRWTDPLEALRVTAPELGMDLGVIFLLSAIVTRFAIRRSLAPLRKTAEEAENIQMDSLGQGLRAEGAPAEVLPLVEAVNKALTRLDASAERMRRYTANAAHELRTPVAILRARVENSPESAYKAELRRDVKKIQALVDQLLMAARLGENQAAPTQEVDLVKTARDVTADYSPLVYASKRKIEFEADESKTIVQAHRQAIECVVANLIDNALHAEPEGGTVLVRVRRDATIEVVDHGDGVSNRDREHVFEPFWRKHEAYEGAGLGLAISKELMDKLGGEIAVDETAQGGATFRISFRKGDQPPAV